MPPKRILIAGALGVIGRALVDHCENDPDIELIGLARRRPEFPTRAEFRSVDLLDRADCERQLSDLETSATSSTPRGSPGRRGGRRWRRT